MRVLVVDDHSDTTEALSILLRILGHQPQAVQRGREAVPAVREFDPHVIVVDIALPDISGYEVARNLRSEPGRRRYLAAATGYGSVADRARAYEVGFDQHLTKPLSVAAVREMLQNATALVARD